MIQVRSQIVLSIRFHGEFEAFVSVGRNEFRVHFCRSPNVIALEPNKALCEFDKKKDTKKEKILLMVVPSSCFRLIVSNVGRICFR